MSTRSSRTGTTVRGTDTPATPYSLFADLPRRQLALLAQSVGAMCRGTEAMRAIQQQAAQRAGEHHMEAAERLRSDCDLAELLSIQADLVRCNMQETMQYWQQLAGASMRMQAEMVTSAQEAVLDSASEPTLDTLQRAFEATLNGGAGAAATH